MSNEFNDSTFTRYDLRTGDVILSRDVNGKEIHYEFDGFNRMEKVIGPLQSSKGYTIRFQYMPFGKNPNGNTYQQVPVAVTYHYQAEGDVSNNLYVVGESEPILSSVESYSKTSGVWNADPASTNHNSLQTATFIDGLGNVVQVKKDISVWNSSLNKNEEKRTYSSPQFLNDKGLPIKEYLSMVESSSSSLLRFNQNTSSTVVTKAYDELNRVESVTQPKDVSGTTTTNIDYEWRSHSGKDYFTTTHKDPENHCVRTYFDANGRKVVQSGFKNPGTSGSDELKTIFIFDPIGQMDSFNSPEGNVTSFTYNMTGQLLNKTQPDAGITTYTYDNASNLRTIKTQNLLNSGQVVTYSYDKSRLKTVTYPNSSALNDLVLTYGSRNDGKNGAARVVKKVQGNNQIVEDFKYDKLGQVTESVKTIWVPTHGPSTFRTNFKYDSWGRTQSITYPDEEYVRYHYSYGGEFFRMYGHLSSGATVDYVSKLGHDQYSNRIHLDYGNQTNTSFSYYSKTQRLFKSDLTDANANALLKKTYTYKDNGNVHTVVNTAGNATYQFNKLGGTYDHTYTYDGMNRLTNSNGKWTGTTGQDVYSLSMNYQDDGNISSKKSLFRKVCHLT